MDKIIKGKINKVIFERIESQHVEDSYDSDNSSDINEYDTLFFIIIEIIDYDDAEFPKYKIKGKSFIRPEINDLIMCRKYKECIDKYDNNIEYNALSIIEIDLPKDKDDIVDRINKKILNKKNSKGIGKTTIDNFVNKYINDFWQSLNECELKNEKILLDLIKEYLKNKNVSYQADKEYISIYFIDTFDLILNINEIKKILEIFNNNEIKIPINKKIIEKNILLFVNIIDNKKLMNMIDKLKINEKNKCKINILIQLYESLKKYGNTCIGYDNLKKTIPYYKFDKCIKKLIKKCFIKEYADYLYLYNIYNEENDIAYNMNKYYQNAHGKIAINESYYTENDLNDDQKNGVINAFNNCFSIITGFPGVGKTKTAIEISKICNSKSFNTILLGPTGKIVLKISNDLKNKKIENNKLFVYTIHKFINKLNNLYRNKEKYDSFDIDYKEKYKKKYDNFTMNDIDMIIIDEISMINNKLMYDLFNALNLIDCRAHIVFMGDIEQLPSIGYGDILNNLIKSGIIPTSKLTRQYRGGDDTEEGIKTKIMKFREISTKDMSIFNKHSFKYESINCIKHCKTLIAKELNAYLKMTYIDDKEIEHNYTFDNIMIITPTHKNIKEFTPIIRNMINKEVKEKSDFCTGDYIMIKKNIYLSNSSIVYDKSYRRDCDLTECNGCKKCIKIRHMNDLYNGMIGKITKEDDNFYYIKIMDNNINVTISKYHAKEYMSLSYINTVHKYQGSENKIAILIFTENDIYSLTKNMIYTGISRAQDKCLIISDDNIYSKGIIKKCSRISKLYELLKEHLIVDTKIDKIKSESEDELKEHLIIDKKEIYKKKKISCILKQQVWRKWIGSIHGESVCPCCNIKTIYQADFSCGHIIAESKGGEMSVDNLKPICAQCNSSMGVNNMDEFIKTQNLDKYKK